MAAFLGYSWNIKYTKKLWLLIIEGMSRENTEVRSKEEPTLKVSFLAMLSAGKSQSRFECWPVIKQYFLTDMIGKETFKFGSSLVLLKKWGSYVYFFFIKTKKSEMAREWNFMLETIVMYWRPMLLHAMQIQIPNLS